MEWLSRMDASYSPCKSLLHSSHFLERNLKASLIFSEVSFRSRLLLRRIVSSLIVRTRRIPYLSVSTNNVLVTGMLFLLCRLLWSVSAQRTLAIFVEWLRKPRLWTLEVGPSTYSPSRKSSIFPCWWESNTCLQLNLPWKLIQGLVPCDRSSRNHPDCRASG